jgi:hypothetical protein
LEHTFAISLKILVRYQRGLVAAVAVGHTLGWLWMHSPSG